MNHKIKFLSYVLIALFMAVFASCEKDDASYGDPKQFGPKIHGLATYLEGTEAEQAKGLLNVLMSSPQARQKSRGWTVDFSEILLVTDTLGNNNYTFRVLHPNSVYDEFYNLVLTENSLTDYTTVKLVRYKMDSDFATRFNSGATDIGNFTGTITFTPITDGGELTPPTEPGEDPEPNPGNDPCEDESEVIVINPGSSNGGIGSSPGSSSPGGGAGNGGPIPGEEFNLRANCLKWITIQCDYGTPGHYGGDATCTAPFKGATYLINECNNTVMNLYGRNNKTNANITYDPCGIVGNIGVLPPRLLHLLINPAFRTQFPCQSQIVEDAYSVCSDLNNIFLNAFEGNETYSVNYFNNPSITGNGATEPTPFIRTNLDGSNHYHFIIKLRDSYLTTGTDLSIARTVIHENFHAILLYLNEAGFIDPSIQQPTYQELLYAYIDQLIINGSLPATNNAHHEFMAQFVADIAATLQAFGSDRGYNLPNSYYESMAWGGLTHDYNTGMQSSWFQAIVPNSSQRDQIINLIQVEQDNQTYNGVTPTSSLTSNSAPCNP